MTGMRHLAPSDQTILETLDGLDTFADELPIEADEVKRDILRSAMLAWASRPCEGERPQSIETERGRDDTCAWCFEQLGHLKSEFNGGIGHQECARFAYQSLAGDDAIPWPVPELNDIDPLVVFCRRLGRESARLGIDAQKLAIAIGRARCA